MKTILKTLFVLSIFSSILFLSACHKEGSGGKASLSGTVKHHSQPIPYCVVYIKYGATELPSTDVSHYDAHVAADASGHYEIKDLYKGDYFLYGVGYDNTIMGTVTGGTSVKIKKNKDYTVDVPVTE